MSLPIPSTPIPEFASYDFEDRGNIFRDKETGSTYSKLSEWKSENVCGSTDYVHIQQNITFNKLVDCTPVTYAAISLKGIFPHNAVTADLQEAVDAAINVIKAQSTQFN